LDFPRFGGERNRAAIVTREFSIYLDLVRFLAALTVYLHHLNLRAISVRRIPLGNLADFGVLAFFLMSGCVIAHVAQTKERRLGQYAASRAARIYSVALPVILLTPLLDLLGRALGGASGPAFYDGYPSGQAAARMLVSAAFLNEIWGWSVLLFSNGPYWSLSYEVAYYTGFALFFYFSSGWRYLALALLALLAGPKIVLLAPIWVAGIWLYRLDTARFLSPRASCALALGAAAAGAAYLATPAREYFPDLVLRALGPHWRRELSHSQNFIGNYVLAALVFLHLLGMKQASAAIGAALLRHAAPIRHVASFTFALYLFHQPLIYVWGAAIDGDPSGYGFAAAISLAVAASVFLLGHLTEAFRLALKAALWPARLKSIRSAPR
jgi:peptidoglycan/LPS O-acetylase OafA/YrhL